MVEEPEGRAQGVKLSWGLLLWKSRGMHIGELL